MTRLRKFDGEWRIGARAVAHWFHVGAHRSRCGKLTREETELDDSAIRCSACWDHWCKEAAEADDGV
jgi:hypothetical protein